MFNYDIKIPIISKLPNLQKLQDYCFMCNQSIGTCSDPLGNLRRWLKWSEQFIDAARSMVSESLLFLKYEDGAYRTTLSILYGQNDEHEVYGDRTLGSIFGNDFFLDCDLIYKRICDLHFEEVKKDGKSDISIGPSKQAYFNGLLRVGVLKPCFHFLKRSWFIQHEEFCEQDNHKFYCISNDVLRVNLEEISEVFHLQW